MGLLLACGGWDGLREAESSLGILNGIALSLGDVGTLLEEEQSWRVSLELPVIATLWRTHSVSVHLDIIGLRSLTPQFPPVTSHSLRARVCPFLLP